MSQNLYFRLYKPVYTQEFITYTIKCSKEFSIIKGIDIKDIEDIFDVIKFFKLYLL